jgi:hypothetical protein
LDGSSSIFPNMAPVMPELFEKLFSSSSGSMADDDDLLVVDNRSTPRCISLHAVNQKLSSQTPWHISNGFMQFRT